MPSLEKFFEKSLWAFLSRNRTKEGVGSKEEVDAPERRGFWDGVDLCLGAMKQLTQEREIEGERERQSEKHQQDNIYKNIET